MEHKPSPLDLELPGAPASSPLQRPSPATPIGEMRTPTWHPDAGPRKRSLTPMVGVAVLALGAAAAVGLYVRHETPPKANVAMAPQASDPVTLPLPPQNTTPPVTDLPAVPPAPAATEAQPAETAAAARSTAAPAKREAAPNPSTRAERSANATAPAVASAKVAEAALKPQPVEPAVTPIPEPAANPAPTPAPSAEPATPSTPGTPNTPPSE